MCTVPLSLQTQSSRSSGRNATPYISALSDPLRSSRTNLPVCVSHIRISVPLDEVVARNCPEGGTDNVVRAEVCAAIIEAGCFVGAGGGGLGGNGGGGPNGFGAGQGGRWINWTKPVCFPGIASNVEWVAVARVSSPEEKENQNNHEGWMACPLTHLVGYRMYPTPHIGILSYSPGIPRLVSEAQQPTTLFDRLIHALAP